MSSKRCSRRLKRGTSGWCGRAPTRPAVISHVLVHESEGTTHVEERNLAELERAVPISHPLLDLYFAGFE